MDAYKEVSMALQTPADFIRWGASAFAAAGLHFGHGTDNAADEAAWLVLHALHLSPDVPPYFFQSRLTGPEKQAVYDLLCRRVEERKPAAYLTGQAWFGGLQFAVNQHVLVPRSAIAELIGQQFSPWIEPDSVSDILDLCTGCGCIAIVCAQAFVTAQVDASDVSAKALEVARTNVAHHALEDHVRLVESDLFAALGNKRYDIIVSNPPYVGREELATLPAEYRHEPALGLDGGGADGMDLVARLLREARAHLHDHGILVVEVGNSWPALEARYPAIDFTWLEFEHGDGGVFLLTAQQLDEYQSILR